MKIWRYTIMRIWKYKIIQIWKYTSVHVEKYRCKKCKRVCKEIKCRHKNYKVIFERNVNKEANKRNKEKIYKINNI